MRQTALFLTKSDLKVAQSCPTKLYYKKLGYPTNDMIDRYSIMLSDGRFVITKISQILHADGINLPSLLPSNSTIADAVSKTTELLNQENITLFEPVIYHDYKYVCPHILVKRGHHIQLLEIKTRGFDSEENQALIEHKGISIFRNKKTGGIGGEWRSTFTGLGYEILTLKAYLEANFPAHNQECSWQISAGLIMPDRSRTTHQDQLLKQFTLKRISTHNFPHQCNGLAIDFSGDAAAITADHFLSILDVTEEVEMVLPEIMPLVNKYLSSFEDGKITKIETPISKHCKNCEFHGNRRDPRDGFRECWGTLADVQPHILDLYQMGRLGEHDAPLVNQLIADKKVSMYDIPLEYINDHNHGSRQLIQLEYTQKQREWISEQLPKIMGQYKYPLHFIDFETSRMAVPNQKGMLPYEQVAFLWSCHTIPSPNSSEIIHQDWLDIENPFPNVQFAESLMECIGETGTTFAWANHENSVLRDIYYQMNYYHYDQPKLKKWLEKTVKLNNHSKGKFVDMNALTHKHYFHPLMKGRTSLKCVLPAVWQTNSYLHQLDEFKSYYQVKDNEVINPYKALPTAQINQHNVMINEGEEAMLAYQNIMYGEYKDQPQLRLQWRELLRNYCALDTLAMVIIWRHWEHLAREIQAG